MVDFGDMLLSRSSHYDDRKTDTLRSRVTSDPAILGDKPVLEGTRVPVELIVEKLAAGESERQVLEAHPHLAKDAVRVTLAFAARALRADVIYPNEGACAARDREARKCDEALSELAAIDAEVI